MGEVLEYHDNIECDYCCFNLKGRPKIVVGNNHFDNDLLCYWCAKQRVPELIKSTKELELFIYQRQKSRYDEIKTQYDLVLSQWLILRKKYLETHKLSWWWSVLFIFPLGYLFNIFGILGSLIIWYIIKIKSKNKHERIFSSKYPEPRLTEKEPKPPGEPKINHCLRDNIPGKILQFYRQEILERDDYTCQTCGFIYNDSDLEVHHIIPKNKDGQDYLENLITLCKYCHDREDWFGHVRINPTTLHLSFEQWSIENSKGFNEGRFDID